VSGPSTLAAAAPGRSGTNCQGWGCCRGVDVIAFSELITVHERLRRAGHESAPVANSRPARDGPVGGVMR